MSAPGIPPHVYVSSGDALPALGHPGVSVRSRSTDLVRLCSSGL